MSIVKLYLIAILEGIVSLGIEVTAFRQISPFYGSSLEVTTLILSVFLIALAVGYKKGGEYKKDTDASTRLRKNFIIVLATAPIFLSYTVMSLIFQIDGGYIILFLWIFLGVALPIYFLGQTLPILSSLSNFSTHSKASSFVMFYSTVGSVVGTIGVSVFLFNTIGVSKTIIVISLFIVAMIGIVSLDKIKHKKESYFTVFNLAMVLLFFSLFHLTDIM